ncbi:MAG TPA: hypothetical protein VGP20_10940 [Steroidobacteraceae bacterium]|nr:hypothetical protein [Steroidobacteraceae bacterium]
MKATAKKILMSTLAVTAVTLGAIGSANAAAIVYDQFGNPILVRTCHSQWVQTGPFYGQGYFARVCG